MQIIINRTVKAPVSFQLAYRQNPTVVINAFETRIKNLESND